MTQDSKESVTPAASAVEEVERLWNRDCGEVRTWYQLALDLARRLEEAQKHLLRWIQTGSDWQCRAESAEAALREAKDRIQASLDRKDALLRECARREGGGDLFERIQKEVGE